MNRRPKRRSNRPAPKNPRRTAEPGSFALQLDITTGRHLAWTALSRFDIHGHFLSDTLSELDRVHQLSSQDRAFAVDVTAGIVRRRLSLDAMIESQVSRPKEQVETDLWRLLQFGAYQLAFAQTAEHAAVDTSVELAKQLGKPRWAGFVNGVLRNIARLLSDESVTSAAQNAMPVPGGKYRVLNSPILPHPELQRVEYFSKAFSLPDVLATRWVKRFDLHRLTEIAFHSLTPPRLTLRVNSLKTSASELHKLFRDEQVEFVAGETPDAITLTKSTRVVGLPGYEAGLWSVQDSSAMQAAVMLDPQPDEQILDLCSAPGGKTCHLAELSGNKAHITACDVSQAKLDRVRQNADRLGLENIQLVEVLKNSSDVPAGPFDAALVDVPCSNTGVLSRRPEARWRFREAELPELTELQSRLLMTAFDRLKPGGRLVYSTCSIEPEETSELLQTIAASVPSMSIENESTILPHSDSDGAYCALVRKAR